MLETSIGSVGRVHFVELLPASWCALVLATVGRELALLARSSSRERFFNTLTRRVRRPTSPLSPFPPTSARTISSRSCAGPNDSCAIFICSSKARRIACGGCSW